MDPAIVFTLCLLYTAIGIVFVGFLASHKLAPLGIIWPIVSVAIIAIVLFAGLAEFGILLFHIGKRIDED